MATRRPLAGLLLGCAALFAAGQALAADKVTLRDRGARISGTDALTLIPVWPHAMRTDSGRPSSSIRFRARTAMAISVA